MIKRLLIISAAMLLICINTGAAAIKGGISMTESVPEGMFGVWLVKSECIKCSNKDLFETSSIDIWTLERTGDAVILTNPAAGARADIDAREVKGNTVKFEKRSVYPDEETIETPVLTLHDDKFEGTDKIIIRIFEKGKLISEEYVEYKVRGEKISGASALGIIRASKGASKG